MTVHPAPQGSEQWLSDRTERFNAGDAAAMLGCDPNGRTRTDLLDAMVKGFTPEVGAFKQRLFDKGHDVEALARPLAEGIVGEDLYPLVGSIEVPELTRRVGASFDGLKMARDINFECKSLNEALAAALPNEDDPDANDATQLPKGYRVQLEQQLWVSGAERVLFGAAAFHPDGSTKSLRWCWYLCDPDLRAEILAGWKQFDADLATHVPTAHVEAPRGEKVEALPMLVVQVEGRIVSSNLAVWREAALAHIAGINKDLKTDDDFANAKEAVKWCDESAKKLKLLKEQTLAQMVDVNELITTMDKIVAGLDRTRIDLDNNVKTRETQIRQEVARRGADALAAHIAALNERIGENYMPAASSPLIAADFLNAIKSKRTVKSLNDSVDAELARCKIAANEVADRIQFNMKAMVAAGDNASFPDAAALVLKQPDDLRAIVAQRVAETERKLADEREKIRAEEQAKAEREAREKVEDEDALIASFDSNARRIERDSVPYIQKAIGTYESVAKDWENDPRPRVVAAFLAGRAYLKERLESAQARAAAPAPTPAPTAAPVATPEPTYPPHVPSPPLTTANVVPMGTRRPVAAPATPPTLKLGQIGERLGFALHADFLKQLGFEPAAKEKSALLFHEATFDLICEALHAHIRTVQAKQKQAA
jgi:predicted phage-related endonuclease